jgi:hypothetical protein
VPLRVRVRLGERPSRDVVDILGFDVLGGLHHERSIGFRPFAAFDVPERVHVHFGERPSRDVLDILGFDIFGFEVILGGASPEWLGAGAAEVLSRLHRLVVTMSCISSSILIRLRCLDRQAVDTLTLTKKKSPNATKRSPNAPAAYVIRNLLH